MKNKKYILAVSVLFFSAGFIFAQDNNEELEADFGDQQIILPEVTTVVTGDSMVAGKDSILDFSNVLPESDAIKALLPVLPGVEISSDEDESQKTEATVSSEKGVYLEGILGGGYPGFFTGDFSVYKSSGKEPFLLRFMHESINGYGRHSAGDGYFDSSTLLSGEKTFQTDSLIFKIKAEYDTSSYGLQLKSPYFYDLNKQIISSENSGIWTLPLGFELKFNLDGNFYTRYSGIKVEDLSLLRSQESNIHILDINPSFSALWKNDFLQFCFDAVYEYEGMLGKTDFYETDEFESVSRIHRGDFSISGGYLYNNKDKDIKFDISACSGVVAGTQIGTMKALPRGVLNFNYEGKYGKASRVFTVKASGGVDSYLEKYSELEENFKFTSNATVPSETSVWFADVSSVLPIGSFITLDLAASVKKPLFGNGFWEACYENDKILTSGLYSLTQVDDYLVKSEIGFSYLWNNIINVGLNYKSNWIHVPSNEYPHLIAADFSYEAENSLWGVDFSIAEGLGGTDYIPLISASGYYRLKNNIRLAMQINDAVKLCSGKNRMWSSSVYEQSSGNVTFLVKVFF